MSAFSLERRGDGRYAVAGELSFDTVPAVWQETRDWFAAGGVSAVDLVGVTRADSAGLAMLLEWLREAQRRGGRVSFDHVPEQIRALARLTGLASVLDLDRVAA